MSYGYIGLGKDLDFTIDTLPQHIFPDFLDKFERWLQERNGRIPIFALSIFLLASLACNGGNNNKTATPTPMPNPYAPIVPVIIPPSCTPITEVEEMNPLQRAWDEGTRQLLGKGPNLKIKCKE